uniref:Putative bicoid n=1 Tax=Platypeza consobrina TaxID=289242 RepID=B4YK68_9MUSC|nr:putative bicoid [Platypeza consobrina]
MAQHPDQNFYTHQQQYGFNNNHQQMQFPPHFRTPYDFVKMFDERAVALNYNYMRPYMAHQMQQMQMQQMQQQMQQGYHDMNNSMHDMLSESLVMRRTRRLRTTFTQQQLQELEQEFQINKYVTALRLADITSRLNLANAQVKIWFKNRRRKHKIEEARMKELKGTLPLGLNVSIPNLNGSLTSNSLDSSLSESAPPSETKSESPPLPLTPNPLTPSPTPSATSTPSASDKQSDNSNYGNQFYYNNNNNQMPQYYQTPPATSNQQQFEFPTKVQQQNETRYNNNNNNFSQQQQFNRLASQEKLAEFAKQLKIKSEMADFNSAELSPNSEVYEPLTPRTDTSPHSGHSDEIDETLKSNHAHTPTAAELNGDEPQPDAASAAYQGQPMYNNNSNRRCGDEQMFGYRYN